MTFVPIVSFESTEFLLLDRELGRIPLVRTTEESNFSKHLCSLFFE